MFRFIEETDGIPTVKKTMERVNLMCLEPLNGDSVSILDKSTLLEILKTDVSNLHNSWNIKLERKESAYSNNWINWIKKHIYKIIAKIVGGYMKNAIDQQSEFNMNVVIALSNIHTVVGLLVEDQGMESNSLE